MSVAIQVECPECEAKLDAVVDFDEKEIRTVDQCPVCKAHIDDETIVESAAEAITAMVYEFALKTKIS